VVEAVSKERSQPSSAARSNIETLCVAIPDIPIGMTPINAPKKPEVLLTKSQARKVVEAVPKVRSQPLSVARSNNQTMRVAFPAIPVGMTPINPPKKPELLRKLQAVEKAHDAQSPHERMDPLAGDTDQADNVAKNATTAGTSPDSAVHLNPASAKPNPLCHDHDSESGQPHQQTPREASIHFRQHEKDYSANSSLGSVAEVHCRNDLNKIHNVGKPSTDFSPKSQTEESWKEAPSTEGGYQTEHHEKESTFMGSNLDLLTKGTEGRCPPRTLLTSESFLETFGEIVAELASGRWKKTLSQPENGSVSDTPNGIVVCDCPLIDIAGADIELSDNSAVVVQYLSSWSEDNQNGNRRGNTASVQQGAKAFIRRLVLLAGSGRYTAIHVILCLDVEISPTLSGEIVTLQNAVVQQSGCACERVTFEYIAPRALAASIALRSASVSTPKESNDISEFIISDENVQERARFLIMLVPTMAVHEALRCLGFSTETNNENIMESGEALQKLFGMARNTSQDLFPYKMEGVLSSDCAAQLWLALNVDISHAY